MVDQGLFISPHTSVRRRRGSFPGHHQHPPMAVFQQVFRGQIGALAVVGFHHVHPQSQDGPAHEHDRQTADLQPENGLEVFRAVGRQKDGPGRPGIGEGRQAAARQFDSSFNHVLLGPAGIKETLERPAREIADSLPVGVPTAVIGIRGRGEILAERLIAALSDVGSNGSRNGDAARLRLRFDPQATRCRDGTNASIAMGTFVSLPPKVIRGSPRGPRESWQSQKT